MLGLIIAFVALVIWTITTVIVGVLSIGGWLLWRILGWIAVLIVGFVLVDVFILFLIL